MSDYKVGYGRPPQASQFKRGHDSKGGRPRQMKSVKEALHKELQETVAMVGKDGRQRRFSKLDLVMKGLVNEAAKGNVSATKQLYGLMRTHGLTADKAFDLDMNDPPTCLAIIERLMHRLDGMKKSHLYEALPEYRKRFKDGRTAYAAILADAADGLLTSEKPASEEPKPA